MQEGASSCVSSEHVDLYIYKIIVNSLKNDASCLLFIKDEGS